MSSLRVGLVAVLFALICALAVGVNISSEAAEIALAPVCALAEEQDCLGNTCQFFCRDTIDHDWNDDDIDGVWIIVEAEPVTDTSDDALWYDNGSDSWAPLQVDATWTASGYPDVTSSVEVDDDGECSYEDDPGEFILCHEFKINALAPSLCDGYSGDWERETKGTMSYCVDHYEYGFDFRHEVDVGGVKYCFDSANVTSLQPSDLGGRTYATNGCGSPLVWDTGETVPTGQCVTTEDPRWGGDDLVRMTLEYTYTTN